MHDTDRVIVSRLMNVHYQWQPISNPRWDHFTRAASSILDNDANSYAEYENCGVVYRIVRRRDLERYGIDPADAVGLSKSDIEAVHPALRSARELLAACEAALKTGDVDSAVFSQLREAVNKAHSDGIV